VVPLDELLEVVDAVIGAVRRDHGGVGVATVSP
jgi:hypothetical protein